MRFWQRIWEEATAQNTLYNIADAEAAVLAKSLPEDPAVIIDEPSQKPTADVTKAHSISRLQRAAQTLY